MANYVYMCSLIILISGLVLFQLESQIMRFDDNKQLNKTLGFDEDFTAVLYFFLNVLNIIKSIHSPVYRTA